MVRNPALYNTEAYQSAANTALENNADNLPEFYKLLKNKDSGVRYWAVVGCFLAADKADSEIMKGLLNDDCHEVSALAAWALYKKGDKETARKCWNSLLANSSYASLKVTNIIDWSGDDISLYKDSLRACKFSHSGYVNRMKETFGVKIPPRKKKKK